MCALSQREVLKTEVIYTSHSRASHSTIYGITLASAWPWVAFSASRVLNSTKIATRALALCRTFQCVLIISNKFLNSLICEFMCYIKTLPRKP